MVRIFRQVFSVARLGVRFERVLSLVLVALLLGMGSAQAADPVPSSSAERYVRYGFTVQNTSGQMVPTAELWVCTPLPKTSTQQVVDLKVSPPGIGQMDGLGNHIVKIEFSNVPPYAVRLVTVEARLAMHADPDAIEVAAGSWLEPDPLFEFNDEAFDRLAPAFSAGEPNQLARDIFDWVRQHVRDTGFDGTDRGALHALTRQRGDCTEFATLFVALCRRAGLPARAMGGYVVSRNAILNPASFHNWAEYYVDGRWHIADPHAGVFGENNDQYVATRVLGESDSPLERYARFRYTGENIKVEMSR